MQEKICINCGNIYTSERRKSKYCSNECKLEYHREHSKQKSFTKKCLQCGEIFKTRRQDAKFCSHQCSADYRSSDKICLYCGKKVKRPSRNYCSKECRGKDTRKPRAKCVICGKENSYYHSVTCSIECITELRRLRRINEIKAKLKKGQRISPFYNKKACKWFNDFDKENNTNGQHAETIKGEKYIRGYWLDYLNEEKKIIIEWNERME